MLQISTGRFWGDLERYDNTGMVPIYSTTSISQSLALLCGQIDPPSNTSVGAAADFTYKSGMPIPEDGQLPGTLIAVTGCDIEQQFVALLTVFSDSFWDIEKDIIERFSDSNKRDISKIPKLFEANEINAERIVTFFELVLSLPRVKYQLISKAAVTLHLAIRLSDLSYDAAFVMAVFAIESLVPSQLDVQWIDFPERTRLKLDRILDTTGDLANKVREILLDDGNFKLQARFSKFVKEHLKDDYFRGDKGVRQSDLQQLIINVYSGRSGFVHALKSLDKPDAWRTSENAIWNEDGPHFTLQGVFFLAFSIIRQIIKQGPHLPREDKVPWFDQISGVVKYRLAPQYWLGNPNSFQTDSLHDRFSDVLEHLTWVRFDTSIELIDLRNPLLDLTSKIDQLPKNGKIHVLGMLIMWSWITRAELHIPGTKQLIEKHQDLFDTLSTESLVLHVWGGFSLSWSADESANVWHAYQNRRYSSKSIKIPFNLESAIRAEIANTYLAEDNIQSFSQYCNAIANDEGKRPYIIEHIEQSVIESSPLDTAFVFSGRENIHPPKTI
jgi:hypothetical protein